MSTSSETQAAPPPPLHEPVHSLHRESDSPPQQSAGWVSPHLRHLLNLFFQPATVDEAHPAPPCMSSHFSPHSILTCIQEKEHTPSSNTIPLSCLFPVLPAVFNAKLSAARKARESCSCSNSHVHQSILFHSSPLFVFIIEGLALNWIVLGFHGRRLWLVQRESRFVAFNWRQP